MATFSIDSSAEDGNELVHTSTWDAKTGTYAANEFFEVAIRGANEWKGGLRFINVTVDQGATITDASITVTKPSAPNPDTAFNITIYGDDVDNAAAWSGSSRPSSGFTNTTASDTQSSGTGTGDIVFDVTSIVQEIVDRGSWASGNAMRFALITNPAESYRGVTLVDYDADTMADIAVLEINTSGGGSVAPQTFHHLNKLQNA